MNPNNQQSTGNNLLDTLLQYASPQAMQQIQNRQNFTNNVNNQISQMIGGDIKNGSNGSAINPVPLTSAQNQNTAQDSALTSQMILGLINGANTQQKNAQDYNLGAGQLGMNERLNGIDPATGNFQGAQNGGGYSPQAVQQIKNSGGADLFPQNQSAAQQAQTLSDIQAAGGLNNYRKAHPSTLNADDLAVLGSTNDTLQKINYLQNQLSKSKSLQGLLNDPTGQIKKLTALNNPWINSNVLHLNPEDQQALSYLTQLNSMSDKSQVGGRLDNYLLQRLGPSGVGIGKDANTNQAMLNEIKSHIVNNNLKAVSTKYGFGSQYDLPNIDYGQVTLQGPDGKTYKMSGQSAAQALQNGWKEAQ